MKKVFTLLLVFIVITKSLLAQTTISVRINSANDDYEEFLKASGSQTQSKTIGGMDAGSSDLEFGAESSGNDPQMVGLRFNTINIPKGSLITGAYIQFKVDAINKNSDPCIVHIKVQDSDSAETFSSNNFDLTKRSKLSDSVTWSVSGNSWKTVGAATPEQRTTNISSLIQNIVNRNGWKSNNSIALFLYGSGTREVESYDGDAPGAPLLVVNFVAPQTIMKRISSADDDMEEWIAAKGGQTQSKTVGALDAGSSDLEFGTEASGNDPQMVGMRFTGINIPKGSEITKAYIQFTVDAISKNNDPCKVIIRGENTDSASTFVSSISKNISARNKTIDSATWSVTGSSWGTIGAATQDQRTSDISKIIQSIIDRQGWKTGNPLCLLMTGTGTREVESFDGDAPKAPLLVLEYLPVKTLNIRVATAEDDQEEWLPAKTGQTQSKTVGALDAGSSDLELGGEDKGNDPQMVGIKFNKINIPQGAQVKNAYIQFAVDAISKNTDPCVLTIKAEDTDSALAYDATKTYNISTRKYTTDSIRWTVGGSTWSTVGSATADQRTPNIAALINKITSRPGWKSGNSFAVSIVGTGTREVESYDGDAPKAPLLVLEYYAGATSVKPKPVTTNYPIVKKTEWLYQDSGFDLSTTWKDNVYLKDSLWNFGSSPLGYGHPTSTSTTILSGASNNKTITHYFRKAFNVSDLSLVTDTIELQLMCDDGAIVYVNEKEVVRKNLSSGIITYKSKATKSVESPLDRVYWYYRLPKSILTSGKNIIAVELHQSDSLATDALFDLTLNNAKFRPNPTSMGCNNTTDHIACYTSVVPTLQIDTLTIPTSHRFQAILKTGDAFSVSGTVPSNFDFTAYVADKGNSKKGYVAVNHELGIGGVSILNTQYNCKTGLWQVDSINPVDFSGALVSTRSNCSGGISPWGTVVTCEENRPTSGDVNLDGYIDIGWNIEIDPVTRKVKQYGNGVPEKLWAMGRMSHENVAFLQDSVTVYQGEDASDGNVYKFVADKKTDLSSGKLYVLVLEAPLNASGDPTTTKGTWVQVPNTTKSERNDVKIAAASLGGTKFNGVEDIEVSPTNGELFFTAKGVGRVYKFKDNGTTVSDFSTFAGGESYVVNYGDGLVSEPWGTGADNLTFDDKGNLWVLQDGGRNHVWMLRPDHTPVSPKVELFMITPIGSEPTGMTFTPDYKYMFISIQEPNALSLTQKDVAGNSVFFNKSHALVVARKEMFKPQTLVTPVISGPTSVLPNSTQNYVISNPTVNPYKWTVTNGNLLSGNGTKSISVKWATTDGSVKVIENQNEYCQSPEKVASVIIQTSKTDPLIEKAGITIKPNPTSGIFNIKTASDAQVSVLDYTGKVLVNLNCQSNQEQQVNLSDFSQGVYYVVITKGNEKQTVKIVKY